MIEPITAARLVAHAAHAAKGQRYGESPYVVHLHEVVGILRDAGFDDELTLQVGYLHDIIEDTQVTAATLRGLGFDPDVIRAIEFCTDQPGMNRRIRKTNTYQVVQRDIDRHPDEPWLLAGLAAKWADRVANLRAATENNPGLLKMYRREWEAFRGAYLPPRLAAGPDVEKWTALVAEYDRLVGGPA